MVARGKSRSELEIFNVEQRIRQYIAEFGIDNFTYTNMAKRDIEIFYYIVNKKGGFNKYKKSYLGNSGKDIEVLTPPLIKNLNQQKQMVVGAVKDKEFTGDKTIDKIIGDTFYEENAQLEYINNTEGDCNSCELDEIKKTMQLQNEMLSKLLSVQQNILANQSTHANEIETIKRSCYFTNDLREKLQALKPNMPTSIRADIKKMVSRYCFITYGSCEQVNMQLAFGDMYKIFQTKFEYLDLEKIQIAYKHNINVRNVLFNCKSDTSSLTKIDVIEKMSLLSDFYDVVSTRLEEVEKYNAINKLNKTNRE